MSVNAGYWRDWSAKNHTNPTPGTPRRGTRRASLLVSLLVGVPEAVELAVLQSLGEVARPRGFALEQRGGQPVALGDVVRNTAAGRVAVASEDLTDRRVTLGGLYLQFVGPMSHRLG